MSDADHHHLTAALALSRRNLGATWPNPSVGCILVRHGRVVGRGVTAPGGRPHGETVALRHAGEMARESTAYVALEPCAHPGTTPSCADSLIDAGVRRVVVPMTDPDPRTSGKGIRRLREAGIDVDVGQMAAEADDLHAGFTSRLGRGRPLVTLKLAASLDGRIAVASGQSRWITGFAARRAAHFLRFSHDALLVGRGTVETDDPLLSCRLPGLEGRSPVQIVADSDLGLSPDSRIVTTTPISRPWIVCGNPVDDTRKTTLEQAGAKVIKVARSSDGRIDARSMLQALALRGITRLLVEGGAILATTLVKEDLVDRVAWFQAPVMIGDDGVAALTDLGVCKMSDARAWQVRHHRLWHRDGMLLLAARR